jgi:hypothetical protein
VGGTPVFPVTIVAGVDIRAQTIVGNVVEKDLLIAHHAMGTVMCHAALALVQGRYGLIEEEKGISSIIDRVT